MYWVLFFITDNEGIQYGSPGVLGFIFFKSIMGSRCTGFYFLYRTIKKSDMGVQVYWVLFFITDNQEEFQHDESLAHNFSKTIHFVFTIIFQTLSLSIL